MISTEHMEIRSLNLSQVASIYRRHLKKDFVREERKPLAAIAKRLITGGYFAYGLYENGRLRAYAFFVKEKGIPCLLLDYLAVCARFRGQGYGSVFISFLREKLGDWAGILAEAESPASAAETAERTTRHRRISFYQNLGFILTGVSCHVFGVDYDILYLPLGGSTCSPEYVHAQLMHLYEAQVGKTVVEKMVRFYGPGEER